MDSVIKYTRTVGVYSFEYTRGKTIDRLIVTQVTNSANSANNSNYTTTNTWQIDNFPGGFLHLFTDLDPEFKIVRDGCGVMSIIVPRFAIKIQPTTQSTIINPQPQQPPQAMTVSNANEAPNTQRPTTDIFPDAKIRFTSNYTIIYFEEPDKVYMVNSIHIKSLPEGADITINIDARQSIFAKNAIALQKPFKFARGDWLGISYNGKSLIFDGNVIIKGYEC